MSRVPRQHLPLLTPLRGVAALMVVFYHFLPVLPALESKILTITNIFQRGYLWVDLFFVLSGFVLTHCYGAALSKELTRHVWWQFIVARFCRIYPLHLLSLAALVMLELSRLIIPGAGSPFAHEQTQLSSLLSHLLLLQAVGVEGLLSWNAPSWSISAEWWVYLLFPGLVWLMKRWRGRGFTVLMALVCYGLWWQVQQRGSLDLTYDFGWLRCLAGFGLGMGGYYVSQSLQQRLKWWGWQWIWLVPFFVSLGLLNQASDVSVDLAVHVCFTVLVCTVPCASSKLGDWVEASWLGRLGDISYSVYMWHYPMLVVMSMLHITKWAGTLGAVAQAFVLGLVVLVIWVVASYSYRLVEQGWSRRLRQILQRS